MLLTLELAKKQAAVLHTIFGGKRSQAYEILAREFYGQKSWNTLTDQLKLGCSIRYAPLFTEDPAVPFGLGERISDKFPETVSSAFHKALFLKELLNDETLNSIYWEPLGGFNYKSLKRRGLWNLGIERPIRALIGSMNDEIPALRAALLYRGADQSLNSLARLGHAYSPEWSTQINKIRKLIERYPDYEDYKNSLKQAHLEKRDYWRLIGRWQSEYLGFDPGTFISGYFGPLKNSDQPQIDRLKDVEKTLFSKLEIGDILSQSFLIFVALSELEIHYEDFIPSVLKCYGICDRIGGLHVESEAPDNSLQDNQQRTLVNTLYALINTATDYLANESSEKLTDTNQAKYPDISAADPWDEPVNFEALLRAEECYELFGKPTEEDKKILETVASKLCQIHWVSSKIPNASEHGDWGDEETEADWKNPLLINLFIQAAQERVNIGTRLNSNLWNDFFGSPPHPESEIANRAPDKSLFKSQIENTLSIQINSASGNVRPIQGCAISENDHEFILNPDYLTDYFFSMHPESISFLALLSGVPQSKTLWSDEIRITDLSKGFKDIEPTEAN